MANDNIHKNHRQRMRAKFNETGFKGWSDYEILEYMLYNVYRQGDTNPIAHDILRYSADNIINVMRNAQDLRMADDVKNVGEKTVLFLRSLKEFVSYYKQQEIKFEPIRIDRYNMANVINIVGFEPDKEEILMVCADSVMNLKCVTNITEQSGKDYAYTSAEKIIKAATMSGASYVIIMHNHPNGRTEISMGDYEMTLKVDALLSAVGVTLIDHMIICGKKVMSIKANIVAKEEREKAESLTFDGELNYE